MNVGLHRMHENRRTANRHEVAIAGELLVDGAHRPITVMNLSLGGALLTPTERLSIGQRVTLIFAIPTMTEPIQAGATVRWSDELTTGLQFEGLRAGEVWALNRYFEALLGAADFGT